MNLFNAPCWNLSSNASRILPDHWAAISARMAPCMVSGVGGKSLLMVASSPKGSPPRNSHTSAGVMNNRMLTQPPLLHVRAPGTTPTAASHRPLPVHAVGLSRPARAALGVSYLRLRDTHHLSLWRVLR